MAARRKTDREILVKVCTDLEWIRKDLENHLRHHWAITLSMIGVAVASIASLIVALLTK